MEEKRWKATEEEWLPLFYEWHDSEILQVGSHSNPTLHLLCTALATGTQLLCIGVTAQGSKPDVQSRLSGEVRQF